MELSLRPELEQTHPAFDPSYVFDAHARGRDVLITRWRGTAVTPSESGWQVHAWQKSVYRFGGLNVEVQLLARIELDRAGAVSTVTMDKRSRGSQGGQCDFSVLAHAMQERLEGRQFVDFNLHCPDAAAARCLHLFEILGAAAGFFAELREHGLQEGCEQELLRIVPERGSVRVENRHRLLGRESGITALLRHCAPLQRSGSGLVESLDAEMEIAFQGERICCEPVRGEDYDTLCAVLALQFGRVYQLEKKHFAIRSKRSARYTNCSALPGLLMLALSHESMPGFFSRALGIECILRDVQSGDCIGFGG